MITAITLENFKGIRERTRIELKPITLLFGANSAGKSTIIQALHYAQEVFCRENLDPYYTIAGGNSIDLGGYSNCVNNKDLSKHIGMRFDLNLSELSYFSDLYCKHNNINKSSLKVDDIINKINSGWIEIKINCPERFPDDIIMSFYEIGINNKAIVRIYFNDNPKKILLEINENHPLANTKAQNRKKKNEKDYLGSWIEVKSYDWQAIYLDLFEKEKDIPMRFVFSSIRNKLVYILENEFSYLGPMRQIPLRNDFLISGKNIRQIPKKFRLNLGNTKYCWADGQAAWNLFYQPNIWGSISGEEYETVNEWLGSKKLDTGYSIALKIYKELELYSPLMNALDRDFTRKDIEIISTEIEKIPIKKRTFLVENSTELEVLPQDIGVGISQVFPVIVIAVCESGIIAIEQPELHLHPAMQAKLGDLFIQQINFTDTVISDRMFLLEIHSEHLILRLLRRIRETTRKRITDPLLSLTPEQVSVIYAEKTSEGVKLTQLRIDETGDFIDEWPKGFFDERAEELFS